MNRIIAIALLAAFAATTPVLAQDNEKPDYPSPNAIVDTAPASEWLTIAPSDLLVMDLAPDAQGDARRVVIQLMPEPFSQGWIRNIRKLAAAHWWDGTSINRVQDNYVVQWGDAGYDNPESGETEQKALLEGLETVPESGYETEATAGKQGNIVLWHPKNQLTDSYSDWTWFESGWPLAQEIGDDTRTLSRWPVHCYGAVGVGRNYSPDTGSGAELYTVIGHAPRHLDRNIAVVGRVIEGIEHLSSLPRGKGQLGFYEDASKRVPITSIRLGNALAEDPSPAFEYLDTESEVFAQYADARANRRDPFFIKPAGGADICNIPVPVRRVTEE
ncbi:peptidylprolyl isomerase [Sphingorhabdus sp. SMR4y]|uniref:peptidylprolyl isomerase n=1 Tax=Sphingorhabdus sp. SMR4y TaxID=2584094 RepID=UPI000B5C8ED6|nr:peptidylprolyl isomerase [Sphingorhabdus sp. SMR4y]